MKKISIGMKNLLLVILAITLFSCDKENNSILPNPVPEPEPVEPAEPITPTFLSFSTSIEMLNEVASTRGTVRTFEKGHEIGLFYNDTCINRKFTFGGGGWSGGQVALAKEMKKIHCYFPYNSSVQSPTAIPVDIETQTDLLVGSGEVGEERPKIDVKMKHLLSLVRITIKKSSYTGAGHVETVTWNGVHRTGKYNAITGTLVPDETKESFQTGGNYYLDDSKDPVVVESILFPVASGRGITLSVVVDGEQRQFEIPATHTWESGKAYTYTLTLKGGYNTPVELDECAIDVNYWSTYGKNDEITLGNSEGNWFSVEPAGECYGRDVYRNEGFMFAFLGYWMGIDPNTGEMPDTWTGDFRMVLMDGAGKIVDKYQPCAIVAPNGGMMKGTDRRSYVTAPVGTYELAVLFRKKGETVWQKAEWKDKVTKKDMAFTVKNETKLPALRMIQVEEEVNTGVVIHDRPYDSNFNITYVLSNRGRIPLKGEIKAIWERTFDYTGHCYRPSSKRMGTVNDDEWRDELGKITIDLPATVRFWKGIIPCSFPRKREMPKMLNTGIGYCTPAVHLYWKAEGSQDWVLLRCDLDPILAAKVNSSSAEAALFLKSLNYISFEQSHW